MTVVTYESHLESVKDFDFDTLLFSFYKYISCIFLLTEAPKYSIKLNHLLSTSQHIGIDFT